MDGAGINPRPAGRLITEPYVHRAIFVGIVIAGSARDAGNRASDACAAVPGQLSA